MRGLPLCSVCERLRHSSCHGVKDTQAWQKGLLPLPHLLLLIFMVMLLLCLLLNWLLWDVAAASAACWSTCSVQHCI